MKNLFQILVSKLKYCAKNLKLFWCIWNNKRKGKTSHNIFLRNYKGIPTGLVLISDNLQCLHCLQVTIMITGTNI